MGGGREGKGKAEAHFLLFSYSFPHNAPTWDCGRRGVPRETPAGIVNLFECMQVRFFSQTCICFQKIYK